MLNTFLKACDELTDILPEQEQQTLQETVRKLHKHWKVNIILSIYGGLSDPSVNKHFKLHDSKRYEVCFYIGIHKIRSHRVNCINRASLSDILLFPERIFVRHFSGYSDRCPLSPPASQSGGREQQADGGAAGVPGGGDERESPSG